MAGLEPARACYGPTDFKSVASTIPPHRHFRALYPRNWAYQGLSCMRSGIRVFRVTVVAWISMLMLDILEN
jgi:hypothetical protein